MQTACNILSLQTIYFYLMHVYKHISQLETLFSEKRTQKSSLGFVPTMGALHKGHLSLIHAALKENTFVVVSIFVNPTQFNKPDDLKNYPRTLAKDIELLKPLKERVFVYAPGVEEVYGGNLVSGSFNFSGLEQEMEGEHRPGHFNGVATVLSHLFRLVKPDTAYFGEKDFQQLQIVRKLVNILQLPIKIVGCPIYRTASGLALSSRNQRLNAIQLKEASFIYKTLVEVKTNFDSSSIEALSHWVKLQFKQNSILDLEYFVIADEATLKPVQEKTQNINCRAFIAVFAGEIRLIDNIALI